MITKMHQERNWYRFVELLYQL